MNSRLFYKDTKTLANFSEAANASLHMQLPEDWWVVVADVMGSTKAIQAGRYKEVNTVGAATIMAVLNVDRSCEIPFFVRSSRSCAPKRTKRLANRRSENVSPRG